MKCETCHEEASEEDRFCQKCGGRLTPTHPIIKAAESPTQKSGTSKVQIDQATLNLLLQEFASKDGTDLSYQAGQIVVNKGELKLTLTELPLQNTKFELDGKFGKVHLELSKFAMEESQLSLDIDVGLD